MMNRNMMNSMIPAIGLGIALSVSSAWGEEAIEEKPIEFECQHANEQDYVEWNCLPTEGQSDFYFKEGLIEIVLNMDGERSHFWLGLELEGTLEPCLSVKQEEFEKKGESAIQLCDQEEKSVIVLPVNNQTTNQRRRGASFARCGSRGGFQGWRCRWAPRRTEGEWFCERVVNNQEND